MTYLSVCSGIEAVSVAWTPLGFKPVSFSEIEKFPCELLKQKYTAVPNYGDMTHYEKWDIEQFDILITGQTVPQKYYLRRKACAGILRRAAKWRKKLPAMLEKALNAQCI